jgi:hypothetical protein
MNFRVGQKVIFIAKPNYSINARMDSGKVATVVKCHDGGYSIFIKDSANNRGGDSKITWYISENDLSLIGGQMLFKFMYND